MNGSFVAATSATLPGVARHLHDVPRDDKYVSIRKLEKKEVNQILFWPVVLYVRQKMVPLVVGFVFFYVIFVSVLHNWAGVYWGKMTSN